MSLKLLVFIDLLLVMEYPAPCKKSCVEFLHLTENSCFQRGNEGEE